MLLVETAWTGSQDLIYVTGKQQLSRKGSQHDPNL